jgi:hypothetical protein
MKQAMNTLCQFSEKERNYFAYQARQDFLRQQGTILFEKDEALEREQAALAKLDAVSTERDAIALREQQTALREQQALAERDAASFKAQQALEEIEKLKALLAAKNS